MYEHINELISTLMKPKDSGLKFLLQTAKFSILFEEFYRFSIPLMKCTCLNSIQGIPPVNKTLNGSDAWVTVLCKKLAIWWSWVSCQSKHAPRARLILFVSRMTFEAGHYLPFAAGS